MKILTDNYFFFIFSYIFLFFLIVTELDAVQSETSNTLLFLQEIKNVVLFKQRRNRFQTDRRNVTTAVLFTDRDDEETKKRGHFIGHIGTTELKFFGKEPWSSVVKDVCTQALFVPNEEMKEKEDNGFLNEFMNEFTESVTEEENMTEENTSEENTTEEYTTQIAATEENMTEENTTQIIAAESSKNKANWIPERSVVFTKRAKYVPSKNMYDERLHATSFELDWQEIKERVFDLVVPPIKNQDEEEEEENIYFEDKDDEFDDNKKEDKDDKETLEAANIPLVILDIRESLRQYYTGILTIWDAYTTNGKMDSIGLMLLCREAKISSGNKGQQKSNGTTLSESDLFIIFKTCCSIDGDGDDVGALATVDDNDTESIDDEEDLEENERKTKSIKILSLQRHEFIVAIITIACTLQTCSTKKKFNPSSLNVKLNTFIQKNLIGNILSNNKFIFKTTTSPISSTDGWRRLRYSTKKVEQLLLLNMKKLRTMFAIGCSIDIESNSKLDREQIKKKNGTVKNNKMKLTSEQWNALLVLHRVIRPAFDRKRGIKCFDKSIPMTVTSTHLLKKQTHAEDSLSFWCFVEGLIRCIDIDPTEKLEDMIMNKLDGILEIK